MNVNIIISILFPSTTAAPATSILTSCEAVWLRALGKRQSVTEAKVVLLCCVVYQESDQPAVQLARRSETPRAVVVLLKGFMHG